MNDRKSELTSWSIAQLYEQFRGAADVHNISRDRYDFSLKNDVLSFQSFIDDGKYYQKFSCDISCRLDEENLERVVYEMRFRSDTFRRLYVWRGMDSSVGKILLSMRLVDWHNSMMAQSMMIQDEGNSARK